MKFILHYLSKKILLSKIAEDFRPVTPLLRGAAPSKCDRPVVIPLIGPLVDLDVQTSIEPPSLEDHVDTDSEVAPEPPDLEASEACPQPVVCQYTAVADCISLLNNHSLVAHLASPCDVSDPQCICNFEIDGSSQYFKFACGARRTAGDTSISPSEMLPPAYRICLRPACCREFDWVVGWKKISIHQVLLLFMKCLSWLTINVAVKCCAFHGWSHRGVTRDWDCCFNWPVIYRLWSCHVALQIGPTFESLPRFGD